MTDHPKIENAPGLVWKPRRNGREARWRARTDLVAKGFTPKSAPLWRGTTEPTEAERQWIVDQCARLQNEMLAWGRGGTPEVAAFDGTLKGLIDCYETDPVSPYQKMRYHGRQNRTDNLTRIAREHGAVPLDQIRMRSLLLWHKQWLGPQNHLSMAHALIGALRVLFSFGAAFLEDGNCERLCGVLHLARFPTSRQRTERMTAEQAAAIRAEAHRRGWHAMALAQAIQFDLMLRQKDVIGEWVPNIEPGISDVTCGNEKWLSGLRWSEIDANLILRHTTSKRGKPIEIDLRLAPMVMEEFELLNARLGGMPLPTTGPVIVEERTGLPYFNFRRKFRLVARAAGVPDNVKSMDSRAGAITEATDAGAELEHVRHAATHSNIAMTQKYSRGSVEKTRAVMEIRAAHRKTKGGGQ